jgi:hypothetical protein
MSIGGVFTLSLQNEISHDQFFDEAFLLFHRAKPTGQAPGASVVYSILKTFRLHIIPLGLGLRRPF